MSEFELPTVRKSLSGLFWVVAGTSALVNILALTGPLFMLQVYDRVLTGGSVPTLVGLSLLMVMLYLFHGVLEWLRGRITQRAAWRFDIIVGPRVVRRLFSLSAGAAARVGLRPIEDLSTLRGFIGGPALLAMFDLPWIPVYTGLIIIFHPVIGLTVAAAVVILLGVALLNDRVSKGLVQKASTARLRGDLLLEEARRNREVLSALSMQDAVLTRWQDHASRAAVANSSSSDASGGFSQVTKTFRMLLNSVTLGMGAYFVLQGDMTAGMIIAVSTISARALAPIEQITTHWRSIIAARQSWARLDEVIEEDKVEAAQGYDLPAPVRQLQVEGVAVAPAQAADRVVQNVSFTLSAGDVMGVLGASGSGKTSLIRGLVGVWPVIAGTVRLDGATPDQWTAAARSKLFGFMPQDMQIFEGSVSENIARFAADASEADVVEAAKMTGAHDMIVTLSEGYQTQVGPSGAYLSGGQRQMIALTRAVFHDPFVVVLDEPNSNLDSEGIKRLAGTVAAIKARGGICILATHAPQMVSLFEKVLIIEHGAQLTFGDRNDVLPGFAKSVAKAAPRPRPVANG